MGPLDIILLIVLIIVGLFVLLDIILIIYLMVLRNQISKKETIINSLFVQQYDLITHLKEMMEEGNIDFKDKLKIPSSNYKKEQLLKMSASCKSKIKEDITYTMNGLLLIADQSFLKDEKKYKVLKSSLLEFSKLYRQETVLYNQNIYGYNYWTRFLPFRPIAFIFKLKQKETLE